MLKISNIKLSDTSISSHRCKDISFFRKVNIIDFFVMGNELCEDCTFLDIPNSAGGIDRTGSDQVVELRVPVKGGKRC